ncbi:MAG: type II toxin-antitoxin system VapC family toxin [Hyphomonadaceae bacterium]|nr:type II toxin-antitoxin system VapC family toxin [Hyphomonadaceae bacterium]
MIGLDTNIVVRLITQDDPAQTRIANRIIEQRLSASEQGFVSLAVVLETVWVLDSIYRFSGVEIATALRALLSDQALAVQSESEVFTALVALEENRASFADALIAALASTAGCAVTLTFDKEAARLPGFELAR